MQCQRRRFHPPRPLRREPPVIVVIVASGGYDGVTPAYPVSSVETLPILFPCFPFLFASLRCPRTYTSKVTRVNSGCGRRRIQTFLFSLIPSRGGQLLLQGGGRCVACASSFFYCLNTSTAASAEFGCYVDAARGRNAPDERGGILTGSRGEPSCLGFAVYRVIRMASLSSGKRGGGSDFLLTFVDFCCSFWRMEFTKARGRENLVVERRKRLGLDDSGGRSHCGSRRRTVSYF